MTSARKMPDNAKVTTPMLRATVSPSGAWAHCMTPRVHTASTSPMAARLSSFGRGRISAFAPRGLRSMSPGEGAPSPSPIASRTSTAKFTYRVCSGRNGVPCAMNRRLAPRNVAMNPNSPAIWNRM